MGRLCETAAARLGTWQCPPPGEQNVAAPMLMAISGHRRLSSLQQYVKPSQAAARLMADTDPARRRK
jgi:hypothetical protein